MPPSPHQPDDAPRHLPLPLAQLRRRADNGKTRLERVLTACYLWEAAVKLAAAAALAAYARHATPAHAVDAELAFLPRPHLGHWRGVVRLLVPWLAARGDDGYRRLADFLERRPSDMPRCAAMAAVVRDPRAPQAARGPVSPAELLDRVVTFRNEYPGHGALGSLPEDAQDRLDVTLRSAADEFLERADVLAGRRLVYVRDVWQAEGCWLVERFELADQMTRLPSLEVPRSGAVELPDAHRVHLALSGDDCAALVPAHPLLAFDTTTEQVLFFNGCKDGRHAKYLCYLTGANVTRDDLATIRPGPLAAALGVRTAPPGPAAATPIPPPPPVAELPPPGSLPRELDEFELAGEIGRGGMGVVYRARQKSLDREVALKLMLRPGDRRAEARFSREVVALGRVDHPNVVKVFTSGAAGDRLYYAMELVEGVDLSDVIDRVAKSTSAEVGGADWTTALSMQPDRPAPSGPTETPALSIDRSRPAWAAHADLVRAVEVVRQVADAAHALHQAKVIHRDIKPGNIRLTAGGTQAVLMDLGLAQLMDEAEGRLTRTRQFVGTLRYASPEQLNGAALDPRADVYSLGATLWELLTLRPLYGVTDQTPTPEQMNTLLVKSDPEKERVRRYNRRVPADLDAIVLKCLRKDPAERYASAADLSADLGRWLSGEPVQAQPPSLGYLLRKQVRRYRVPLSVAAVVLVAALAGLAVAFWQINKARDDAVAALGRETEAKELADQQKNDADRLRKEAEGKEREIADALKKEKDALAAKEKQIAVLARSYARVAEIEYKAGNAPAALNWMLRALAEAPKDDPLRRSYRQLLAGWARPAGGGELLETKWRDVAISPDEYLAAAVDTEGLIQFFRLGSGELLHKLPIHNSRDDEQLSVEAIAFTPNGRSLFVIARDKQKVPELLSFRTDTFNLEYQLSGSVAFPLMISDDGQWLAGMEHRPIGNGLKTTVAPSELAVWDHRTGKLQAKFPHRAAVLAWEWLPDGRFLTLCEDGWVRLWSIGRRDNFWLPDEAFLIAFPGVAGGCALGADSLPGAPAVLGERPPPRTGEGVVSGGKEYYSLRGSTPIPGKPASAKYVFSPRGDEVFLWATSEGGQVAAVVWDLQTGRRSDPLPAGEGSRPEPGDQIEDVRYAPDGSTVSFAIASRQNQRRTIQVPLERNREGRPPSGPVFARPALRLGERSRLSARTADDRWVASRDGRNVGIAVDGVKVCSILRPAAVADLEFSRSGRYLIVRDSKSDAAVIDLMAPTAHQPIKEQVGKPSFSPEGRFIVGTYTPGNRTGEVVGIWEVATQRRHPCPETRVGVISATGVSQDAAAVLVAGRADQNIKTAIMEVWERSTPRLVGSIRVDTDITCAAISPNGKLVAAASSDGRVRVWDTGGRERMNRPEQGKVVSLAFNRDGTTLLVGDENRWVRFFDVEANTQSTALRVATWFVDVAALSPDSRLAAVREGREVSVIDSATGIAVWRVRANLSVGTIGFGPAGRTLVALDYDGRVHQWRIPPPWPDDPSAVAAWVHSKTGLAFDPQGELVDLKPQAFRDLGRQSKAALDWEGPLDAAAWLLREADSALAAKAWDTSLFYLDQLVTAVPDRGDLQVRKAQAHFGRKEWRLAAESASKALAQEPGDAELLAVRATASAELGDWKQAVRDWEAAWRLKPENSQYGYNLGLAHLGAGDERAFREQCRRMAQRYADPKTPGDADQVAWLAIHGADPPELAALTRIAAWAVKQAPDSLVYLETRGAVHYRAGRYFEAILDLQEAVKKERASDRGRLLLSLARRKLGRAAAVGFDAPWASPFTGLGVAVTDLAAHALLLKTVREVEARLGEGDWAHRIGTAALFREAQRELGITGTRP